MATKLFSNNETPSLLFEKASAPSSPAAGFMRLFFNSLGILKAKDSAGTVRVPVDRTSNAGLTTPGDLVNGDMWVEASGTSPSRTVTLYLRDGGSSVPLQSWTY